MSKQPNTPGVEKFTPGPWEWDCGVLPPDGPGRYADIYIDGGETIIASFNDCIPEGKANARLIAAAPDLLDALVELSGWQSTAPRSALVAAYNAIKKARGA